MGMRVNTGSGIDPKLVDQLIELEREPVRQLERREHIVQEEKGKFDELKGLVVDLSSKLSGFKTRSDFYKLKLESSFPDIIDGVVTNDAIVGNYEMEVRSLARTHKLLTDSFPDKNESSVGFGYLLVELDDGSLIDVTIEPDYSTLQDVVNTINQTQCGAKAIIVNTKESIETEGEENYRLLVVSEKSGKQGKIYIEPDTTYLDFKEQVTGKNLHVLFEDVDVYSENNTLSELLQGAVLNVKRAEPGTKVNISINYDIDATIESIKELVETYNKFSSFVEAQFKVNPETNRAGILAKDNTLKTLRRTIQSSLQVYFPVLNNTSLAEVGIITDAKTGSLKLDEPKLRKSLSEDYEGVAKLFIHSEVGDGAGVRLYEAVKDVQDVQHGVIPSKDREYKKILANFEQDIERKERLAEQRAQSIKRRYAAVEQLISGLNSQGKYLQQKFGAPNEGGGP